MQDCCGCGRRPAFTEEFKANYPECHTEHMKGKADCRIHCGYINYIHTAI
jgi:hypothetical protein